MKWKRFVGRTVQVRSERERETRREGEDSGERKGKVRRAADIKPTDDISLYRFNMSRILSKLRTSAKKMGTSQLRPYIHDAILRPRRIVILFCSALHRSLIVSYGLSIFSL